MIDLTHIDCWIFDLDNTLYPAECNLFAQIDDNMRQFIENALNLSPEDAHILQKHYYTKYGTTLHGLMKEHGIAPDHFLEYVHNIDVSALPQNPELKNYLSQLPGKRYIFTNGSAKHAQNVATRLEILDLFDGVFDIEAAIYQPKPKAETYHRFIRDYSIRPHSAVMFEDIARNLTIPHQIGMTTILVQSNADWLDREPEHGRPSRPGEVHPHVHHQTNCLTKFLKSIKVADHLQEDSHAKQTIGTNY
ncbi:MAG: pyrimidine 5'-nucleotidase [bacterium]